MAADPAGVGALAIVAGVIGMMLLGIYAVGAVLAVLDDRRVRLTAHLPVCLVRLLRRLTVSSVDRRAHRLR